MCQRAKTASSSSLALASCCPRGAASPRRAPPQVWLSPPYPGVLLSVDTPSLLMPPPCSVARAHKISREAGDCCVVIACTR